MWRYLEGVKNPEKRKIKQNEEEQREYQKTYDKTKRVRKFDPSWNAERKWLVNTMEGMKCQVCGDGSKSGKIAPPSRKNVFISGCTSYKLESVEIHEKSNYHLKSTAWKSTTEKAGGTSQAEKVISSLNKALFAKLSNMFRSCHALAVHNRPLADFEWMCRLDGLKGVDLPSTYRNRHAAKTFLKAIADVEFAKVRSSIESADFVTIMGDGSTDISTTEQEMWFVRSSSKGDITVHFIGSSALDKADVSNMYLSVKKTITSLGIDWNSFTGKLVCLGCDGAKVMLGEKSGLAARLKADQPSMIPLHCMAHRLELTYKDSVKKNKLYDKAISTLAMGLYYFYSKSPLNRANLRHCARVQSAKVLYPTRVSGTRWVGHIHRALTNILAAYPYIVLHLEQLQTVSSNLTSKDKAVCFLKLLKSKAVVCMLTFLLDVSAVLRRLSVTLQDRLCVVGDVKAKVKFTLEVLKKYKESDGAHLRTVIKSESFKGVKLCNDSSQFLKARKTFIANIEAAITKRFEDLHEGVVSSTCIANLRSWPSAGENYSEFGDQDIQVIVQHFREVLLGAGVDPDEVEVEWTLLKQRMYSRLSDGCALILSWAEVNKALGAHDDTKNVLAVMDLILCLAPSSAEVERGFTQLKLIKTDRRNRMDSTTLQSLLAVKLLSNPVEDYDPSEAVRHWHETANRRPTFRTKERATREFATQEVEAEASNGGDVEEIDVAGGGEALIEECEDNSDYSDADDSGLDCADSDLDEDTVFAKLRSFSD